MKKQRKYSKNFIVGAIITGLMMVLLIWGLIGTPYDPDAMDASLKFAPVSFKHLMGCDNFGRDIFSRVLVGLGSTLLVATGTVLIGTIIGTIIGAVTGYFGGVIDQVLDSFDSEEEFLNYDKEKKHSCKIEKITL